MNRTLRARKVFTLMLVLVFATMVCVPAAAETWRSREATDVPLYELGPTTDLAGPPQEAAPGDAIALPAVTADEQPAATIAASAYLDAFEVDDTAAQARAITLTVAESHTIHVLGDEDWVKFDVVAGGRYLIETLPGDVGFDTELYLFASDGVTQLEYDDDSGHSSTFSEIEFEPTVAETVYVAAKATGDSSTGAYRLRVTGGAFGEDAYEPDNDMASARAITVGAPAQERTLHVTSDDDWVSVELLADHDYTFQTHPGDPDLDTYLHLYDSSGVELDSSDDDGVGYFSAIYYTPTSSGTYYLKVRPYGYSYTGRYLLTATSATNAVGDAYEVDNTPAASKPILTDGSLQARSLHVVDDLDYVSFQAQAGVLYQIETHEISAGLDTEMYVYDSDGVTELAYNDDSGVGTMSYIEYTATESETLYVLVHPYDLDETGAYALSVLGLTPDAYEVDDTSGEAKPIAPGVVQRRTFHEDADVDWVKLDVIAGLKYVIDTRPGGADMDTLLYLYDSDTTTELDSDDDSGPGYYSHIEYQATESKTLYIYTYGYVTGMYLLRVECDDLVPPITTSNALPSYNVSATIALSASDPAPGVGVAATYYVLDGAAKQTYGGPLTVNAAGVHTLQYWSVDKVTNEESVKVVTFQVIAAKTSSGTTSGTSGTGTSAEATTVVASVTATPVATPEAESQGDGEDEEVELMTTSAGDLGDDADGESQAPILGWILGGLLVLLMIGGVAAFARKK